MIAKKKEGMIERSIRERDRERDREQEEHEEQDI